ncbi:Blue-light-activated protein [Gemmata obscuriglobus]|uniref:histidine kinase n=1 Tax=Gemmata obscuriglobus TaxID=114 RepID=A0A2Z3GUS1_9BACT|nr:PAS domain S-box protein [Gemmata obscuriglobus]AWM37493.1 hybrid sensor histidine kinase/response regulator [Gemmata obscuriglobus]QEG29738.1 Blue-light-activated protein [Gemmata obscuriglobus]VTS09055.1 pas pac sensor hybrid histidine kinase : PAS/PAC sensor hybrid histidine kinase OS=Caldithrix abyssi DSM 13497 GN=Calab_1764 PE=4 SV=1: Response_reg: PAS: PAS_4: PAS_4: PAS_9: HisKA: HATPase_c: Response_reg [Gemmata obscuriglobus UQM 2246]
MIAPPTLAHVGAPSATVLIVEDDAGLAELEQVRLEDAGYRVLVAATAAGALAALATTEVDLILLDYRLPDDTDGLDFYVQVKAAGYDVPVILVTGFSSEATVIRALRLGVRDFVTKSIEYLDYLPDAVERALGQVRTECQLASLIAAAHDAIIGAGPDRRVTLFNPAAERMFRCPAAGALGRPVGDFIPGTPSAGDGDAAPAQAFPARGIRQGGDEFPAEVSVSLGSTGGRRFYTLIVRDVTERERMASELRRTGELLGAVVEGTTDAIFVKDRAGRYLLANSAAAAVMGRPAAEVLGRSDADLFDPVSARVIRSNDLEVIETGRVVTDEEALTTGGQLRTFSVTKAPHRNADGAVVGVLGISRDVTERNRLAGERDALLARLRLQIERMPLGYILFGADARVVEWNPAAERIFGHPRSAALGMSGFDLMPASSQHEAGVLFERIRSGDMSAHSVNENLTRDGRVIVCEWHNTPLFGDDGRFTGFLCLTQDVTARRAAEEALRVRDRAIQAVTQGILISDAEHPDHPVVFASPGFERLTGYTAAEVMGRNWHLLQGRDTSAEAVAQVRAAVRAGVPCAVELLNYKKDGSPFWSELSISPVRDATGRLTHFIGVHTDVTRRRNLEDQFRQAQKMDALGRLAGGVAHDFNNLLTVINGYSTLLLNEVGPKSPLREHIEEIRHAGKRSADLTRQLLAFSRQQVLAPQVLDLSTVTRGTEKLLRQLLGADIRLRVSAGARVWPVRADPGQIEQVLMNLAVNARDAMPTGGALTVEIGNAELDEGYAREHRGARPGPHVRLSVSDTGTGMSQDVLSRIFEPFFTTKAAGHGTGLGLSTVYGIVEQSAGHLAVTSAPGAGTRFDIYFPRAAEPAAPGPVTVPTVSPAGGAETVLVVEDDARVRAFARLTLTARGYKVLEASDGAEALAVAAAHPGPIHLLLTDVVLPGASGRVVAEQLRAGRPGLEVLFMSGYTDGSLLKYGVRCDTEHFLPKPFLSESLAAKVREALDHSQHLRSRTG